MILMGVHIFLLTVIDIFIHNWDIVIMVGDAILLWLNYYSYMTLNKLACAVNIVVYVMFSVIAVSHIERIFSGELDWKIIVTYFLQFFGIYLSAAFVIYKRLSNHF